MVVEPDSSEKKNLVSGLPKIKKNLSPNGKLMRPESQEYNRSSSKNQLNADDSTR
jgi:hypothetical protein